MTQTLAAEEGQRSFRIRRLFTSALLLAARPTRTCKTMGQTLSMRPSRRFTALPLYTSEKNQNSLATSARRDPFCGLGVCSMQFVKQYTHAPAAQHEAPFRQLARTAKAGRAARKCLESSVPVLGWSASSARREARSVCALADVLFHFFRFATSHFPSFWQGCSQNQEHRLAANSVHHSHCSQYHLQWMR